MSRVSGVVGHMGPDEIESQTIESVEQAPHHPKHKNCYNIDGVCLKICIKTIINDGCVSFYSFLSSDTTTS